MGAPAAADETLCVSLSYVFVWRYAPPPLLARPSSVAASSVAHCRFACLVVAARAPTFAAEKTQSLRPLLRDVDKLIVKVVASRVEPAIAAPQIGAGPGWPRPGATHLHTRRHPRWRLSA